MKRVVIVLAILLFAAAGLSAQIDYDVFGDAFEDFASARESEGFDIAIFSWSL